MDCPRCGSPSFIDRPPGTIDVQTCSCELQRLAYGDQSEGIVFVWSLYTGTEHMVFFVHDAHEMYVFIRIDNGRPVEHVMPLDWKITKDRIDKIKLLTDS